MMRDVVVIAVICASAGAAQQSAPPPVFRVGGGVSAPVLISKQEPEYSEEARKAKLDGTALLHVVIAADGTARDIRVVKPVGLGLDEKAIQAVSNWVFAPGTKEGAPVAVEATIEVSFHLLLDPHDWHLTAVNFVAPPGATLPALLQTSYVRSTSEDYATARVAFDIDPQGVPQNIHVNVSSDPKWDDEVMALVREWRFQAALDHGVAVESKAYLDLSRGLNPNLPPVPGRPPMKKQ